jgi:CubicO group peptidase (beta-lactamase class C family)
MMPGHNGGANWGSSAVDPLRGRFYVVSKELPTTAILQEPQPTDGPGGPAGGRQQAEPPNAGPDFVPYTVPIDFMLQSNGLSAIGPPWSQLTAYDLNSGRIIWQLPNGDVHDMLERGIADPDVLIDPAGPLDQTTPARGPITIRDLLTHTSGLAYTFTAGEPLAKALSENGLLGSSSDLGPDEWMERLGSLPLAYQPGSRWHYSLSTDVLGVVVERASGMPFAEFLRTRLFEPLNGASSSCTSETYAGPSELSEPESVNIDWIAEHNDNIRFAMNLHSSGNYFMWSPGAYITPGRISAPRPTLEEESFFWGASSRILTEIKRHRGLSVTPARTGPISDVLYSAAGNSGDLLWYKHGIYAWNFEVGTSFQPPFTNANPNGASGHEESQEYANGLIELMRVAHDFDKDSQRPTSTVKVAKSLEAGMVRVSFDVTEPAAVFYTLDGATPTYASSLYAASGLREGAESLTVPVGTQINWFSVDSAGNVEKGYRPDGHGKNFNKATGR